MEERNRGEQSASLTRGMLLRRCLPAERLPEKGLPRFRAGLRRFGQHIVLSALLFFPPLFYPIFLRLQEGVCIYACEFCIFRPERKNNRAKINSHRRFPFLSTDRTRRGKHTSFQLTGSEDAKPKLLPWDTFQREDKNGRKSFCRSFSI